MHHEFWIVTTFNKIFGSVYHLRLAGKRFKAWNRNAYYTAKYAVLALAFSLIAYSAFV